MLWLNLLPSNKILTGKTEISLMSLRQIPYFTHYMAHQIIRCTVGFEGKWYFLTAPNSPEDII